MKKTIITTISISMALMMTGCALTPFIKAAKEVKESSGTMIVGEDVTEENFSEFYYTIENINYDAYFLRYKFYNEDGKHMFFFEERRRPDDYGPTTEEDTIAKTEFELSDKEWSKFYETISGGEVCERDDDPGAGDTGPWTYLYWSGDKDKYQKYSFESKSSRQAFEELCEQLVNKSGASAKSEAGLKNPAADPHEEFENYYNENFTVSSGFESFVTELEEDYTYSTQYPAKLFGAFDHYIGDLDDDDQDEMLVTQLVKDDVNENLLLSVFEYDGGAVELAASYEFGERMLEPDGGNTFVFLYRYSNYPVIGIMKEDYYYTRADGMDIGFVTLNYADGEFLEAGGDEYAGSDMEDNGLAKEYARNGIDITWDDLFENDIQKKVLDACDGLLLAEFTLGLDKEEKDDNYMPVKLYRHAEVCGYSEGGTTKKSGEKDKTDKTKWKSLEDADYDADSEYIFPDSANRLLTEDDLRGKSNEELRRGRNEIAARHGRKFSDESLQKYFDSLSWYEGTVDADEFNKKVRLNDIELKNMDFIKKHEK